MTGVIVGRCYINPIWGLILRPGREDTTSLDMGVMKPAAVVKTVAVRAAAARRRRRKGRSMYSQCHIRSTRGSRRTLPLSIFNMTEKTSLPTPLVLTPLTRCRHQRTPTGSVMLHTATHTWRHLRMVSMVTRTESSPLLQTRTAPSIPFTFATAISTLMTILSVGIVVVEMTLMEAPRAPSLATPSS